MDCGCAPKMPKIGGQVLEVNHTEYTIFHKVIVPASMGDDTQYLPENGLYRNVLLWYEANNHSYLYSSDGIPTLLTPDETKKILEQLEELEARVATLEQETIPDLQDKINDNEIAISNNATNISKNTAAIEENAEAIAVETSAREQADTDINGSLTTISSKEVQLDTTVEGNTSTVTVTKTIGTINDNGEPNTTAMPLPVASATTAGVVNPSTYNTIQDNANKIVSILDGAVALNNLAADISQADLTEAWKTATGQSELINRASIFDTTNQKIWYYYTNVNEWYWVKNTTEVNVSTFTNETAGIILGSDKPGQIFAEADGTGSVVDWDTYTSKVDNLIDELESNPIPTLYDSYAAKDDGANTARFINSKLNGPVLMLGGGTSRAANNNGYAVILGNLAQAQANNSAYGTYNNGIAIGYQAKAMGGNTSATMPTYPIAIGQSAYAGSSTSANSQIALGPSASATGNGGVALGSAAVVSHENSVALGRAATSGRKNEVSIGSTTNTGYATRYLANVTTGELDTDAVNVAQLNASRNATWQPNYDYLTGELIVNEGKLYSVDEAFTSGETFDATGLTEIDGGGGDSVPLYNVFSTATDGANTAAFINGKLNSTSVILGEGAKSATTGNYSSSSVVIGNNAVGNAATGTNDWVVAVGTSAQGRGRMATALGYGANAGESAIAIGSYIYGVSGGIAPTATGKASVAIGANSSVTTHNSVAIGSYSRTTRDAEFSIGKSSGSGPQTRYLANVTAGTLDTDATNVAQLRGVGIGDILYASTDSADSITLSKSIAQYERVLLIGQWEDPYLGVSIQVNGTWYNNDQDQVRSVQLHTSSIDAANAARTDVVDTWTFSNATTLTLTAAHEVSGPLDALEASTSDEPHIVITKVLGFKPI